MHHNSDNNNAESLEESALGFEIVDNNNAESLAESALGFEIVDAVDIEQDILQNGDWNDLMNLIYYHYLKTLYDTKDFNFDYIEKLFGKEINYDKFISSVKYHAVYKHQRTCLLNANNINKMIVGTNFINTLYDNNNKGCDKIIDAILSRTSTVVNHITLNDLIQSISRGKIPDHNKFTAPNNINPRSANTASAKLKLFFNFAPENTTSIPAVFCVQGNVKILRFGAQVRTLFSTTAKFMRQQLFSLDPIFCVWLKNKSDNFIDRNRLAHIYFNDLFRDESPRSPEKKWENSCTRVLEKKINEIPHVACITMPSEGGLLNHKLITQYKKCATINMPTFNQVALKNFILFLCNKSEENVVLDSSLIQYKIDNFFIPDKLKQLLKIDKQRIELLFNNSIEYFQLKSNQQLTFLECSAVFFHFFKYELTNFIIETLQPDSVNFTCKDAIDRGGVHGVYYYLVKTNKLNDLCSADPFERNKLFLHCQALMVKARLVNHHCEHIDNILTILFSDKKITNLQQISPKSKRNKTASNINRQRPLTMPINLRPKLKLNIPLNNSHNKHNTIKRKYNKLKLDEQQCTANIDNFKEDNKEIFHIQEQECPTLNTSITTDDMNLQMHRINWQNAVKICALSVLFIILVMPAILFILGLISSQLAITLMILNIVIVMISVFVKEDVASVLNFVKPYIDHPV